MSRNASNSDVVSISDILRPIEAVEPSYACGLQLLDITAHDPRLCKCCDAINQELAASNASTPYAHMHERASVHTCHVPAGCYGCVHASACSAVHVQAAANAAVTCSVGLEHAARRSCISNVCQPIALAQLQSNWPLRGSPQTTKPLALRASVRPRCCNESVQAKSTSCSCHDSCHPVAQANVKRLQGMAGTCSCASAAAYNS